MAYDEMAATAMREAARLEQEVARLRVLLGKAADQITDHNSDYRHRTPREFIAELRNAALGINPHGVTVAGHHTFPQETPPIPEEPQSPTTTGGEKNHG